MGNPPDVSNVTFPPPKRRMVDTGEYDHVEDADLHKYVASISGTKLIWRRLRKEEKLNKCNTFISHVFKIYL